MSAPEFLIQATQGWARTYGDSHLVSNGVRFLHLAGLLVAGGLAVAADRATLVAARCGADERLAALARLATTHRIVVAGLAVMFASGAAMFLADVETFWETRVFWVKMALIVALLANGLVMQQGERQAALRPGPAWTMLKVSSIASVMLWMAAVLASTILGGS